MRRLLAAGCLLCCIAAACLCGAHTTRAACDQLDDLIAACKTACEAGDLPRAAAAARALEADWDAKKDVLAVFVNHGVLDEIDAATALLEPYAAAKDAALYRGECKRVQTLLDRLRADASFHWHSLF